MEVEVDCDFGDYYEQDWEGECEVIGDDEFDQYGECCQVVDWLYCVECFYWQYLCVELFVVCVVDYVVVLVLCLQEVVELVLLLFQEGGNVGWCIGLCKCVIDDMNCLVQFGIVVMVVQLVDQFVIFYYVIWIEFVDCQYCVVLECCECVGDQ